MKIGFDAVEQNEAGQDVFEESAAIGVDVNKLCIDSLITEHLKLDRDEQKRLAFEFRRSKAFSFRDELMRSAFRWVIKLAYSYSRKFGYPHLVLDMIQEGMLGLISATKMYDPAKGFAFSTYATWWIRHQMVRYLMNEAETIRIPVHRRELLNRLLRAEHTLRMKLGREVTDDDLLNHKLVTKKELKSLGTVRLAQSVSIDEPLQHEGLGVARTLLDILPCKQSSRLQEILESKEFREKIALFLRSRWPGIDAEVVILRFGLGDEDEMTLQEVGERFGFSRERARQRESRVLGDRRLADFLQFLCGRVM